jgi:hypothetical protein
MISRTAASFECVRKSLDFSGIERPLPTESGCCWRSCEGHPVNEIEVFDANRGSGAVWHDDDMCRRHFQCITGCDYEDSLGGLLGDLMHWSDRNNFDFQAALCRARGHYAAETAGE